MRNHLSIRQNTCRPSCGIKRDKSLDEFQCFILKLRGTRFFGQSIEAEQYLPKAVQAVHSYGCRYWIHHHNSTTFSRCFAYSICITATAGLWDWRWFKKIRHMPINQRE